MAKCVGATDFIGGGTGALDAYDGNDFSAGDAAMVYKNGQCIPYIFVSSSVAEHSPWLIQPDTNGTGVRWQAVVDSGLNIIRSSMTLYLSSTGNDTTNTGMTSGSPWATLNKAVEWLGDKIAMQSVTVTISIAAGSLTHSTTVLIVGNIFKNVEIVGAGSSSTTLTFATAGVGAIKIDSDTYLKDIRNIKLLGDGTSGGGYGIEVTNESSMRSSGDLLIDSFATGLWVNNNSYVNADGAISCKNNDARGAVFVNGSSGRMVSCVFDNNGTDGLYASTNSNVNAASSTSTNNTTGYFATLNSHIQANSTTVSGNTTDYDPAKTTANDPTFDNFGSWIYG